MPGWSDGEPDGDCDHDVVDRPVANEFCRKCGEINPE